MFYEERENERGLEGMDSKILRIFFGGGGIVMGILIGLKLATKEQIKRNPFSFW